MASSILGSLKLVSAIRENNFDAIVIRRKKMIEKIQK